MQTFFPDLPGTPSEQGKLFSAQRISSFFIIFLQLAALFVILSVFSIEKASGISRVAFYILAGFILSTFTPLRFRPAILFLLSVCIIFHAFGLFSGSLLIIGGLVLIGTCHLPLKLWLRIILLLCIAAVMILLRTNLFYAPRAAIIIPFLASMFMFRIFLYLHELHFGSSPAGFWQRLSYFFLFPNHCFLLFPIIDYKTYLRTYYLRPEKLLWQKGIRWMLRGILHLLVYRIIYLYFLISQDVVSGPFSLLLYAAGCYAFILRISGLFHFITGLLCLFGIDLPLSFNNYFIATSFVDVWRRTNTYWRDFLLKIFFYPITFRLKKLLGNKALPASLLLVFIITWALHNYQWFWIRGHFPLSAPDMLFWGIIGLGITINSVLIERSFSEPRKKPAAWVLFPLTALKITAMFLIMSFLWSLWSSASVSEWIYVVSKGAPAGAGDIALLTGGLIIILVFGTVTQWLLSNKKIYALANLPPEHTAWITIPAILLLLFFSFNITRSLLPASINKFLLTVSDEKLNSKDQMILERGYYKTLIDGEDQDNQGLWEVNLRRPNRIRTLEKAYVRTNGVLSRIYKPALRLNVNDYVVETNSVGMRDREYTIGRPDSTFRFALLGGSYEAGAGVNNSDIFKNFVEKKLNQFQTDSIYRHFQILNFAVPGYYLLQHVELCRSKVFQYEPNALIYVAHSDEYRRLTVSFSELIVNAAELKDSILLEIKKLSGVRQSMSEMEIRERLHPYMDNLLRWCYLQIAQQCSQHHVVPVWAYLPTTSDTIDENEFRRIKGYAEHLGFITMDLRDVYNGTDRKSIALSEWDSHPNAQGHLLIADKFYGELLKNWSRLLVKK